MKLSPSDPNQLIQFSQIAPNIQNKDPGNNIKTYVSVKPCIKGKCIKILNESIIQLNKDKFHEPIYFSGFDKVAGMGSNFAEEVADDVSSKIVRSFLDINQSQCILSWGSKQTGKTRCLFGRKQDGLIYRCSQEILESQQSFEITMESS